MLAKACCLSTGFTSLRICHLCTGEEPIVSIALIWIKNLIFVSGTKSLKPLYHNQTFLPCRLGGDWMLMHHGDRTGQDPARLRTVKDPLTSFQEGHHQVLSNQISCIRSILDLGWTLQRAQWYGFASWESLMMGTPDKLLTKSWHMPTLLSGSFVTRTNGSRLVTNGAKENLACPRLSSEHLAYVLASYCLFGLWLTSFLEAYDHKSPSQGRMTFLRA